MSSQEMKQEAAWGTERDCVWVYWDEPLPDILFEPDPPLYLFNEEIEQLELRRRDWIEGLERDAYEHEESILIAKYGPDAVAENRD